jgi:PAS domain S-box-containing protein
MVPALPRLFEMLVQDAPDAIVYADAEGVIRFWNRGAERIFGFTAAETIGQSLDIIIPENQRARHWEGYRAVMKSGASRYGAGDLLAVPGLRKGGERHRRVPARREQALRRDEGAQAPARRDDARLSIGCRFCWRAAT